MIEKPAAVGTRACCNDKRCSTIVSLTICHNKTFNMLVLTHCHCNSGFQRLIFRSFSQITWYFNNPNSPNNSSPFLWQKTWPELKGKFWWWPTLRLGYEEKGLTAGSSPGVWHFAEKVAEKTGNPWTHENLRVPPAMPTLTLKEGPKNAGLLYGDNNGS